MAPVTHTDATNTGNIRYILSTLPDSTKGDIHPGEWRWHVAGNTDHLEARQMSAERASQVELNTRHNLMTFVQTSAGLVLGRVSRSFKIIDSSQIFKTSSTPPPLSLPGVNISGGHNLSFGICNLITTLLVKFVY